MPDFHVTFADLLHAVNLRHWTDGFTSLPKEGVLRIFSPWKIQRLRSGLNPRTLLPKASTLPLDHRSRYGCSISLRATAAEERVRTKTTSCRICGEQICTAIRSYPGTSVWLSQLSLRVLRSCPVSVIPPVPHTRIFFVLFWWYNSLLSEIDRIVNKNLHLCKQTNKMHFLMYLFYNLCTNLHVSNDHFVHRQEFINLLYLQLCTNHANVHFCMVCTLLQRQKHLHLYWYKVF